MSEPKQTTEPTPRWLSKVVLGFGLASLLSDAGHEAGTAALPVLLTTMAAAPATLGLIEGIADGGVCFAKLFGGSLANRPTLRKPLAVVGYAVTGLSIPCLRCHRIGCTSWRHESLAGCSEGCAARHARRCWPTRCPNRLSDERLVFIEPWIRSERSWGRCWRPCCSCACHYARCSGLR